MSGSVAPDYRAGIVALLGPPNAGKSQPRGTCHSSVHSLHYILRRPLSSILGRRDSIGNEERSGLLLWAGKSTLLNLLAQRPAAIVSDIAGTTRDVVQVIEHACVRPCACATHARSGHRLVVRAGHMGIHAHARTTLYR